MRIEYNYAVNGGNWTLRIRKASGTSILIDLGVTVVAGTVYQCDILIKSGVAKVWINGTLLYTTNPGTEPLPNSYSEPLAAGIGIMSLVGSTSKTMITDFVSLDLQLTNPRAFA